ncbi:site-specific DNA-methyltransferase [Geotoga petraea]|uniref:Site-specific DNA-methyltransferase n=1 Tax=Geotoga petraea TaxID=28234 RepID=A0A4Z0VXY3_9BACT|nr:site-specific DNA-methyltransferase [Geotoga petraea]TGG86620.1 site-specific DNA-methyltransferase [Geotoga petraea]
MKEQKTTNNIQPKNKNFELLRKHFSNFFDNNENFDFEKFKRYLSKNEDINFSKESYGMDWLGKSYARLLANDEATTLLREDEEWNNREENKNSEHLLIKGDNLEVLKLLSNAYYEKIKMIYIDPPYNTGGDGFVYEDNRKFTVEELSKLAGIDEDKAKRILEFTESKSNSHSAWLTFMYPRLYIAKQLLKEDGVIFVSIDDNEVAQLRLLMDEIFGEENFVEIFNWQKTTTPPNLSNKTKKSIEYILLYQKQNCGFLKGLVKESKSSNGLMNQSNSEKVLTFPEKITKTKLKNGVYKRGSYGTQTYKIELLEDTEVLNGVFIKPIKLRGKFKWSQDYLNNAIKNNVAIYIQTDAFSPSYEKKEYDPEKPWNIINKSFGVGTNENAGDELDNLFVTNFSEKLYPKPTSLIKYLINFLVKSNDIILDFFAGSGTTGDAIMQLNAEDGGNRKYILVQLPEEIDSKKNKTAYDFVQNELNVENPTIFEITKERLIRAAKKIKIETLDIKINKKQKEIKEFESKLDLENYKEKIKKLEEEMNNLQKQDLGFKIFQTIPNNEGKWENYILKLEKFAPHQKLFNEDKLNNEDLKTLLTTWKTYDGIKLTQNLKEIDLEDYRGYYFDNKLYLVNKGFETKHLKKLLEEIDENRDFYPATIIAFGYNFESKMLREIEDNIKIYKNKKQIDIDFIVRY